MNERLKAIMDRLKPTLDLIKSDKTKSFFRISYGVIWNLFLVFFILGVLLTSLAVGVGAGYFASLVKDEPVRSYESMEKNIYNYEETSQLYFADNVPLGKLRSDIEREEVKLEDVSQHLINAVIATEDSSFWEHPGVVPKAIFRALFQEFTNSSIQSGGSTLTQQLVKNQILTNEISFERKAKEILLALRVEQFFDKEEILEAYLNVSTFGRNSSGRNIAGVQSAAQGLFGVDAKDLTIPQAAFIAGLPQSPFEYTPFTYTGELKEEKYLQPGINRMKIVLSRMLGAGYITEKEYNEAVKYDIVKDFIPRQESTVEEYPYLTYEIEERAIEVLTVMLAEKDNYTREDLMDNNDLYEQYRILAERDLRQNGYHVHTTVNKEIYDAFQEITKNFKNYAPDLFEPSKGETEPIEVGMMLIENKSGRILSFVGGRDFKRENTNHATKLGDRPNGSTMKPLFVYGPAIDKGIISPGTVIADVDLGLKVNGQAWPQNFSRTYYGLTTARQALQASHNVSAVSVLQKSIGQNPGQYLEKMGITSLTEEHYQNLSTGLGAPDVSVEENTNAYATFANGGEFVDSYMIEKIVDSEGKVIYEHKPERIPVFSKQASYLTLDMMRDVLRGPTGTARSIPGMLKFQADWAGKTGTSEYAQDIWFVGFNPNVTAGIWMGYDTPKTISNSLYSPHLQLWAQLMNAAYDIKPELIAPKERFQMPGGIVKRSFCLVSGLLPSDACREAGLIGEDYFIAQYAPTKVDDSLIKGKYVTIGKEKYLALPNTPSEFAEEGLILNPDFIDRMVGKNVKNKKQLIPNNPKWSKILIPDAKMEDDGSAPSALNVTVNNNTITWKPHSAKDVIGYRVFKLNDGKATVVKNIKASESLSFKASDGTYYVVAVDIAGKESSPSNNVQVGNVKVEEPSEETGGDPTEDPEENKDNVDTATP